MNIKPAIYENLTIAQRVMAILEAIKRGDHAEGYRLIESVDRKSYDLPDAEFTDTLFSQMLADETFADKAGAYKALQSILGRKECSGNNILLQIVPVGGTAETGPIYPEGYEPEKVGG